MRLAAKYDIKTTEGLAQGLRITFVNQDETPFSIAGRYLRGSIEEGALIDFECEVIGDNEARVKWPQLMGGKWKYDIFIIDEDSGNEAPLLYGIVDVRNRVTPWADNEPSLDDGSAEITIPNNEEGKLEIKEGLAGLQGAKGEPGDSATVDWGQMPIASEDKLGGFKVGAHLFMRESGVLDVHHLIPFFTTLNNAYSMENGKRIAYWVTESDTYTLDPDTYKDNDLIPKAAIAKMISDSSFSLPVATKDTLGGVKVGETLNMTDDGVLSADWTKLPDNVFLTNRPQIVTGPVEFTEPVAFAKPVQVGEAVGDGDAVNLGQIAILNAVNQMRTIQGAWDMGSDYYKYVTSSSYGPSLRYTNRGFASQITSRDTGSNLYDPFWLVLQSTGIQNGQYSYVGPTAMVIPVSSGFAGRLNWQIGVGYGSWPVDDTPATWDDFPFKMNESSTMPANNLNKVGFDFILSNQIGPTARIRVMDGSPYGSTSLSLVEHQLTIPERFTPTAIVLAQDSATDYSPSHVTRIFLIGNASYHAGPQILMLHEFSKAWISYDLKNLFFSMFSVKKEDFATYGTTYTIMAPYSLTVPGIGSYLKSIATKAYVD